MPPDKRPPPRRGPVDTEPQGQAAAPAEPTTTEPSMPAVSGGPTDTEPSMPVVKPPARPASAARLAPVARERPPRERPARERPSRRTAKEEPKKRRSGPLLVLLVLVAGGFGGAWYYQTHLRPRPASVPVGNGQTEQLQELMQQGKNLVRQGKFAEAKGLFQQVFDADPGFAQGAVKSYLDACVREIPNQQHLAAAAAAVDKGEVAHAWNEVKAVTANTNQADRVEVLKQKIDELIGAHIAEGHALAGATGDKAKMKKLKALAEDVLVARPDQRDALELKDLAARALGGPVHVEVEAPPEGDPAVDVQARYASGDATGAFAMANECAEKSESCRSLGEKMKEFNALLAKVESLSPEELDRALTLDHQCSGGKTTPHARPVAVRMASAFYEKASAMRTKGSWGGAMAAARKALEADPSSVAAQGILGEGMAQARTLFERCYIQKDESPEDAMPLCQEVVKMLPEGNELRGKAERVLQSLRH